MTVAFLAISGCSPKIVTRDVYRDSLIYQEAIVYRDTTINYVVEDSIVVNITRDTISRVETDYAASEAIVEDGVLLHWIRNKAGLRPIEIRLPEVQRSSEKILYETRCVDVPAQLSKWQEMLILLGRVTIITIIFGVGYLIFKIVKNKR